MKVLLVSENRCRDNLIPYPLGIAWLAAASARAGHEVRCLDLMFSEDPAAEAAREASDFKPDCVGLSVRNIDNQDMLETSFYLPPVREVVVALRAVSGAPIVLGGAGFSIFPAECLRYLDVGLGVVGEGESAFPALLAALAAGADPSPLPGVASAAGGRVRVNPPAIGDLTRLPPPDRAALDVSRYNWQPGAGPPFTANIQSRRGCHMGCVYCSSPLIEGRRVRARGISEVADEMQWLDERGIRSVIFTDSLFNYPADYARALCREVAGRRLSITWTASVNPAYHDPELFRLMRLAGCTTISLGNESGSDEVLGSLGKGFGREDVARTVAAARAEGLDFYCFLMVGGPGETRGTVEESVGFLDGLGAGSVRVTLGVRVYPGCELERTARREGIIEPGRNLLYPTFYVSPGCEPWLRGYMESVCRKRPGWST